MLGSDRALARYMAMSNAPAVMILPGARALLRLYALTARRRGGVVRFTRGQQWPKAPVQFAVAGPPRITMAKNEWRPLSRLPHFTGLFLYMRKSGKLAVFSI
jgi:hypothetical protein